MYGIDLALNKGLNLYLFNPGIKKLRGAELYDSFGGEISKIEDRGIHDNLFRLGSNSSLALNDLAHLFVTGNRGLESQLGFKTHEDVMDEWIMSVNPVIGFNDIGYVILNTYGLENETISEYGLDFNSARANLNKELTKYLKNLGMFNIKEEEQLSFDWAM